MKPKRTLILLADDRSARFLLNDGPGKGLRELASITTVDFDDTSIAYEDRPGRQTGGPGGVARHGFDAHETADELGRERFARHVAASLDRQWAKAAPDQLIVAAPPKMLGVLRSRVGSKLAEALLADLAKNLTGIPLNDLAVHFQDIVRL